MWRCVNDCMRRHLPTFWKGFLTALVAAIIGWISGIYPVGLVFGAAAIFVGLAGLGLMIACYFTCR